MKAQVFKRGLDSKLADAFAGGFVILFGLWLNFWAIPRYIVYERQFPVLSPESVPAGVSLILVLLGAVMLVKGLLQYRTWKQVEQQAQAKKDTKALEAIRQKSRRVSIKPVAFVVLLLTILYACFLTEVGFLLGTCVLIFVLFKLLGGKKWWQGAILSVGTVAALWVFFRLYLHIALPEGFFGGLFG